MPARKPPNPDLSTRVLRLRLKDKHAPRLREWAYHVNQVWNYCNELAFRVWDRERRFLSAYDIDRYTAGATKAGLPLHSQTVQAISAELVARRKQHKKVKLRWRVSGGARRSLGWVPFKASALRYRNGQLLLAGIDQPLSLWDVIAFVLEHGPEHRPAGIEHGFRHPCLCQAGRVHVADENRPVLPRPVLRAVHAAARKGCKVLE